MRLLALTLLLLLPGCNSSPGKAVIGKAQSLFGGITPAVKAEAPANAEQPSTVSTGEARTEWVIQPGAKLDLPLVVNGQPVTAKVELPEVRVAKVERTSEASTAAPRAPDKQVELRKADNAERRPLLYAAIGCMAIAVLFVFLKYPAPALLSGVAGGLFFAAWHLSGERWLMNVAVGALVVGGVIYAVWEFAERKKKDESTNE